jgi:hypothetical protein
MNKSIKMQNMVCDYVHALIIQLHLSISDTMIHIHVFIEQQLSSIHVHASENKASLDEQKRKVRYVMPYSTQT